MWATHRTSLYHLCRMSLTIHFIHPQANLGVFIRNLIVQVVERHLMSGVRHVFNPQAAYERMTADAVAALFTKDEELQEKRVELDVKIRALKDALFDIRNFGGSMESTEVRLRLRLSC